MPNVATATATAGWFTTRWPVADLSEKTKITFQVGGAISILVACILVGKYWGGWESDSRHLQAAVDAHEIRLTSLENRLADMNNTLTKMVEKQDSASKDAASAARNTQYSIELLRDMETALATRGITTEKHGP